MKIFWNVNANDGYVARKQQTARSRQDFKDSKRVKNGKLFISRRFDCKTKCKCNYCVRFYITHLSAFTVHVWRTVFDALWLSLPYAINFKHRIIFILLLFRNICSTHFKFRFDYLRKCFRLSSCDIYLINACHKKVAIDLEWKANTSLYVCMAAHY